MDLSGRRARHRLPPDVRDTDIVNGANTDRSMTDGVVVCVKWALPPSEPDERFASMSAADQAALELALVDAESSGVPLTVVTAGPVGADRALREGLARGAQRAIRIDLAAETPSPVVARWLATVTEGAPRVWCGDYSADRGSGSVPAFIACLSGRGQALGLVAVVDDGDGLLATRRLDGGRLETLRVVGPAVLSVEGSAARLRRASLSGTIGADRATIEVMRTNSTDAESSPVRPFRPRARVVAPPRGTSALDRVREVIEPSSGAAGKGHHETVELEPAAAARRIVDTLVSWGYLA